MLNFVDELARWPEVDFAAFGSAEIGPHSNMQKIVGRLFGRNRLRFSRVTPYNEIDITAIEARRRAWNIANVDLKLTSDSGRKGTGASAERLSAVRIVPRREASMLSLLLSYDQRVINGPTQRGS